MAEERKEGERVDIAGGGDRGGKRKRGISPWGEKEGG